MKKILSLVLVLMLVVCTLPVLAEEEPVELSILARSGTGAMSGYQDDPIAKYIEDKLNIRLNVDFSVTDEKLAGMLASGSLPDVCWVYSSGIYVPMVESGAVINMIDYIAESENIQNYAGDAIAITQKTGSFGNSADGVYFIPTAIVKEAAKPAQANIGLNFRWDYYEELGCPELTDIWTALDIVKQMYDAHPVNEEGVENVGISFFTDWGGLADLAACVGCYFRLGWGRDVGFAGNPVEVLLDTDEIVEMYTDYTSSMWLGLKIMNYCNRIGILDPDSFTQTEAGASEKQAVAACIASIFGWDNGANAYLQSIGQTEAGFTTGSMPVAIKGTMNVGKMSRPVGSMHGWCISSNCQNVDAAMRFLDWIYTDEANLILINGVEGEEWYIDENGEYRLTEQHAAHLVDENAMNLYGFNKYKGIAAGNVEGMTQTLGCANDLTLTDKAYASANYTPFERKVLDYYGVETKLDLVYQQYDPMGSYTSPLLQGTIDTTLPDELALIAENIHSYMESAAVELIQCETEEAFDALREQVVADVQDMGLQDLVDYCKAEIEDTYAFLETLK